MKPRHEANVGVLHARRLKTEFIEADVRTTSMAPSGEAVAHHEHEGERRAVFVLGAAPSELVRVRFDPSERPARGEILEILEPSPERVRPACAFVEMCGGCDWMHLSREAQRKEHLALAAPIARGATLEFHSAHHDLAYRTRARLHAREERGRVHVGWFAPRSRALVRVDSCAVLDPRVDAARAKLEALLEGSRGEGDVSLALGRAAPVADIVWSRELAPAVMRRLDERVRAGAFQGFRVRCGEARRAAFIGDPTPVIDGADGAPLELPAGGFSQAHEGVNASLALRVAELAEGAKKILELYAGAGNLTILLARAGSTRAVESSEPACEAARKNLAARSLEARVTCADAATFEIPSGTDLVVLDPPRTGAREACERIAQARSVKRVVYVSCDRATLARDLELLVPVFDVSSVDVFEMFPQTSHAETVVALSRKKAV